MKQTQRLNRLDPRKDKSLEGNIESDRRTAMTDSHSKESMLTAPPNLTEEERERRKRKLMQEWQKLENAKVVRTELDDFIEIETRAIGRRLESQSEHYSPKCV